MHAPNRTPRTRRSFDEVRSMLRRNEVGRLASVDTPYGRRLLCYADMTATGRYLHFVESWVRRARSFYANTHTTISSTGRIMTSLREEARRVVRRSVHAGPDDEALFVGAGSTAAINKLVGLIGLRVSEPLEREFGLSKQIPPEQRPVVIVGPYEHHSNELPWLESVADLVEVGLDDEGRVDLADLRRLLALYAHRPLRIGSFSAASNVTGLLTDVRAVARVLHEGGAYACFDYAAAGPYAPIDMHPEGDPLARIDAVFLSVHKFLGGPQSSGILVTNRALIRTRTPERPGGGTVDYVAGPTHADVDYTRRTDEREEGGTPAIMGDIRAGIALLVKEMSDPAEVLEHETRLARASIARLARHPRLDVLGSHELPRLGILSFNVRGLHHDLVSVLLDQLFGIQNRAGCSCAGPYGHRLLGIDHARSERYRALIAEGLLGLKPGWVRVSLPFYGSDEDIEFILRAIEFVADHGRDFVPTYALGWRDGVWRHLTNPVPDCEPLEMTVDALFAAAETAAAGDYESPLSEHQVQCERARYFAEAERTAAELRARWEREPPTWNPPIGRADLDAVRWFDYVHAEGL